jgi:hypothetical protein
MFEPLRAGCISRDAVRASKQCRHMKGLLDTSRLTPVARYVVDPLRELHQLRGRQ